MIYLSKPIRHKVTKEEAEVSEVPFSFLVTRGSRPTEFLSASDFNDRYENIPEPRKPREWMAYENRSDVGLHQYCPDCIGRCIRVIEWPVGAALPDWPEGYE